MPCSTLLCASAILLEKVENLGNLGDRVNVKSGYGRNFLLPSGKATPATAANIEIFEKRRAELEKVAAEALASANSRKDAIEQLSLTLTAKAGDEVRIMIAISMSRNTGTPCQYSMGSPSLCSSLSCLNLAPIPGPLRITVG